MQRTFHSHVGWWYWSLIAVTTISLFYCFWLHYTLLTLLLASVVVLEIEMLIHTKYIITGDGMLRVETGRFIPKTEMDIVNIISIRNLRSMKISSPSLSFDRLEITSRDREGKAISVQVSPQNMEDFVISLSKHNNAIQLDI